MRENRKSVIKSLPGALWVPTLGWGEGGNREARAPVPPGTHGWGGKRSRSDKRGLMDNHKSSVLRSGECLAKGETLRIQGELAGQASELILR